ncbi:restriction endonuclease subunit S [Acinetobacter cumulans]|uniref:restriction endonuclease subunit S n=1 Tax=Acinetobacter cumulans TaxID=2136182 RepID=UPI0014440A67|nr:restriction endonuclease subunit S [Acinetobacter cumulans]
MAQYEEYKLTYSLGFEKIPKEWNLKKVKYLFDIGRGRVISQEELMDNGLYPVFSSQTQNNGCLGYINTFDFDCEQLTWTTDGANAGTVFIRSGKHNCTNVCGTLQPITKNSNLKFSHYALQYATQFHKRPDTNGAKIMNNEMAEISFALPPEQEQFKIVEYLNYETAIIDSLIEKQQQLIELLKEKRQAVISHAVTKGLDPNVPMKDSGVEWLGEVPEHWIVKSYRLASRIYRGKFGHRPRNDPAFYDGDYPFIQTGDVARAGKYITSYSQTLNEKGKEVSQLFPKGTLMMAIAANIGDIAILGFEAYAPDSVVGFKPNNDIDLEFLRYSFIAALPALEQTSTQSTQANLNVERIGAVKGTFPSLQEQREIVGYLDNLLEQYRNLVKIAENAISLMQERRTALISAAVTGKIDVRNWQAPSVTEADTELSA